MEQAREGDGRRLVSASEVADMTDRIDALALAVRQLPDRPLSQLQKVRLKIIGRELLRRTE